MEITQYSQYSAWRSLLWKDWQQIKSMLLAVLIGLVAIQLLMWAVGSLRFERSISDSLLIGTQAVAYLSPVLIVVGCCGLLIGQERQTGTWHWATSLPVRWTMALASKLLVTLAAAAIVFCGLQIVPLIELFAGEIDSSQMVWMNSFFSGFSLLFLVEVFVILTLACLLLREPLTAIAVAGIAMIIGQFALFAVLVETILEFIAVSVDGEITVSRITIFIMLLFAAIPMLFAFRWRWGAGQFATFVAQPAQSPFAAPGFALRSQSQAAPRQWTMLTQHSLGDHFWLRIFLTLLSLTFLGGALLAIPFSAVVGLTTFESDQTLGRFRFLADRGVSPVKLACNRLMVSFFWWIAAAAIPLTVRLFLDENVMSTVVAIEASLFVFVLAAFVSLCFRRIVVGIALVAAVSLIAMVVCVATPPQPFKLALENIGIQEFTFLRFITWALVLPTICILTAGIMHVAKRWIIRGNERLVLHFAWICALAAFLPILLSPNLAYLLLPSPAGWPLPDPQPQAEIQAVDLLSLEDPVLTRGFADFEQLYVPNFDKFLPQFISDFKATLDSVRKPDEAIEQSPDVAAQTDQRSLERLASMKRSADLLEVALDKPAGEVKDVVRFTKRLNLILFRTAIAAHLCMQSGDTVTSRRLWRLNRRLQEIGQQVDSLSTGTARIISMKLLARTDSTKIDPTPIGEFMRELIPNEADERAPQVQGILLIAQDLNTWLKTGKSAENPEHLEKGWITWLRVYPPGRWFLDRVVACQSVKSYDGVQRLPRDYLSGEAREELLSKLEGASNAKSE